MFILYDIIFLFFVIGYLPILILKKKWHVDFKMRFGFVAKEIWQQIAVKPNIWFHAVSVGEVLAVCDLIVKLTQRFPNQQVILTTVTKTGNDLAKEKLAGKNVIVIYAPLDFSWLVRKFIRKIKPKIYISAETEFWPNLFLGLVRSRIAIVQVNGRVSDNSFRHYRMVKWLIKPVLNCVSHFCMQTTTDLRRIKDLGVDGGRIEACGNLKFDLVPSADCVAEEHLKLQPNYQFLIAGSTHDGEEEILIDIYRKLVKEFPKLRLILAPRHIERVDDLMDLAKIKELTPIKYSQYDEQQDILPEQIVVVDVIGKLRNLYRLATLVFVGKSLTAHGGQNMIEPAVFGRTVIVGPNTENFRDVMTLFLSENAIVRIQDPQDLENQIRELLQSPQRREVLGAAAQHAVEIGRGATERTLKVIESYLK